MGVHDGALDMKAGLQNRLHQLVEEVREVRDNQTAVPCSEDDDICGYFDIVIDKILYLMIEVGRR